MRLAVGNWRLTVMFKWTAFCCLLLTAHCQLGCSIPNLEGEQCGRSRDTVREFYSWYLGTDADMRAKQKEIYDRFISPNFAGAPSGGLDPFFLSDTTPTTFKVGKCQQKDDSHVDMQVQIYWRHDGTTDQKQVYAKTIKTGDKWLIDKVESR
jgi:hypothetical protein